MRYFLQTQQFFYTLIFCLLSMNWRKKPKTLENLAKLDSMFEGVAVKIKPLNFPPVVFSKKDIAEYNPTDFSITLLETGVPSIFIDCSNKTAKAYPSSYLQQKFSGYEPDKAKKLMGVYYDSLNTLRRHGYSIAYNEILGPQDLQIAT